MKKILLTISLLIFSALIILTFSSANSQSENFQWTVDATGIESFQDITNEWTKGQIENNEFTSLSNGKIEFFGKADDNYRITLEKNNGDSVVLATADSRSQDNDPCNWNDNICIVDRNGQLLFASAWDSSSSIDTKDYGQCPIITCGVGNNKCSSQDIRDAKAAQGLEKATKFTCKSDNFQTPLFEGEKIKTYFNDGGNIGIRVFGEVQEERTASDSGPGSVKIEDGNKLIAIFNAQPLPEKGGIISNVIFELTDDNPSVITTLQGNQVFACLDSNQDGICDYLQINDNLFIKINSPEAKTYNISDILVDISSDGTQTWFTLNGGNNMVYTFPTLESFPEGTNTLTAFTENSFGNTNSTSVVFEVNTTSQPPIDNNPPGSVTLLNLINKGITFLTWQWDNPSDSDFSHAIVYLDGVNVINTSNNLYNATGLAPNSTHTLTINTVDFNGNINDTDVSNTATTLSFQNDTNQTDTTPPSSITNLQLVNITNQSLKWQWDNPSDSDFSHVKVFLDNVFITNSYGNMYFAQNLISNTSYTIKLHTVDTSGNVNTTDITNTGTTLANPIIEDPFKNLFIKINSPEAKTYNISDILVDISSDGTQTWFTLDSITNESYVSPITKTFLDGTYVLTAFTENSFGNTNSTSVVFEVNTTSQPPTDTTVPNSIENLNATDITNTTILWTWDNPSDSDFSHAIVFLDGGNALNTSSESFQAIGLIPNSTHTVIIWTADTSGNINNTDVSNTATTLSVSNGTDDNGHTPEEDYDPINTDNEKSSGGSSKKSSSRSSSSGALFIPLNPIQTTTQINETEVILLETEDIYTLEANFDYRLINFIIIVALIIICLLIIITYAIKR
jgi:hypothetical protein